MKLLLTVCLTCALLYRAASLNCHVCDNELCSNSTSVQCPATSVICRTVTTLRVSGTSSSWTVHKNCSTLLSCFTPLSIETEWSVNRGFTREANTQLCCVTDNCNFQTLAIPNDRPNGKECPACASADDALNGTCNVTLPCEGVEDSCFNGTITSNSTQVLQLGCVSRNLCAVLPVLGALFGTNAMITCGAPWSIRISAMLLPLALAAHKVLT